MKNSKKNKTRRTRKSKARPPYGGGYRGLALAICEGNVNLARHLFGI